MRNRPNVLNILTPLIAAAGCVALASPAFAQQTRPGEVMGMRYLSWSGKAAAPADGLRRSAGLTPAPIPVAADNSRYPAAQTANRPSRYGAGTGGLTPASVWTGGEPPASAVAAPAFAAAPPARQPELVQQADPALQAQAQVEYQAKLQADYQAWYQSEAQAQYQAQVRDMPQPQPQPQVVQMPAAEQQAATQQMRQAQPQQQRAEAQQPAEPQYEQRADAGPPPGYDPMAPRRDAMIFRMQPPQPAPQPQVAQSSEAQPAGSGPHEIQQPVLTQPTAGRTYSGQAYAGAEPPRESARYYSVHRGEGRQPDPIAMPQSVYLDNAPIDLAEPPAAPIPGRTVNGRTQVIVPNQDPSLP